MRLGRGCSCFQSSIIIKLLVLLAPISRQLQLSSAHPAAGPALFVSMTVMVLDCRAEALQRGQHSSPHTAHQLQNSRANVLVIPRLVSDVIVAVARASLC